MGSFAQDCTLFQNFENEAWLQSGNGSYTQRTVTDELGRDWIVSGVCLQSDVNDRKHGLQSIRLRGNTTDGNCRVEMDFDKSNGIGVVSFYYASYSTHSGGTIALYYSTNGGSNWVSAGDPVVSPAWGSEMIKANFPINIQGNVRIKIVREGGLASGTTVNIDDLCLTDFNPAGYAAAPTFNPPGGSYTNPISVTISSSTPDATIRYTLDGTDPVLSSTTYSSPVPLSEQTTIKARAWKEGMEPSTISTANYIFPQGVTTLAALRELAPSYNNGTNTGTTVFTYTGEAVVTHIQPYRNVKYIQDPTGAMYIYDQAGSIQAGVEVGDKVTNVSGTLTNYFGMVELIPTGACEVIGYLQKIKTTDITASQLDFDHSNPIQAKVVTIKNVLYMQTGVFENGKYYNLKEGTQVHDSVVYTDNYDTDYIGDPIPTILVNINGVINFKGGSGFATKNRIVPLNKSNNVIGTGESINNINKSAITLSPNPANSFVNIVTDSPMKLEIFSLIGNLISIENLYEGKNTVSVSELPAGLYFIKLTDKNSRETFVQKLVVQ